jgi:hypothetical protein
MASVTWRVNKSRINKILKHGGLKRETAGGVFVDRTHGLPVVFTGQLGDEPNAAGVPLERGVV